MSTAAKLYNMGDQPKPSMLHRLGLSKGLGHTVPQAVVTIAAATSSVVLALAAAVPSSNVAKIALLLAAAGIAGPLILTRFAPWYGPNPPANHRLIDALLRDLRWKRAKGDRSAYASRGHRRGYDAGSGAPIAVTPPPELGRVTYLRHQLGTEDVGVAIHHTTNRLTGFYEVVPPPKANGDPEAIDRLVESKAKMRRALADKGFTTMDVEIVDTCTEGLHGLPDADLEDDELSTHPLNHRIRMERIAAAQTAPAYRSWYGVVIAVTPTWKAAVQLRAKHEGISTDEATASLVVDEMQALRALLPGAGYEVLGPLSASGLITLTRSAWDPDVPVTPPGAPGPLNPADAYPIHRDPPDSRHVRADGWDTSVYDVLRPSTPRPALFDRSMIVELPALTRRTVTYSRFISSSKAAATFEREATATAREERLAHQRTGAADARAEISTDAATARSREVLTAGDIGVATATYVLLHTRSSDSVTQATRQLRSIAEVGGQTIQLLYKQQAEAVTYGTAHGVGLE